MRCGFDDGTGAFLGFDRVGEGGRVFHEDAAAYKDRFGSELHDQARIRWRRDASGGEIRDGQLPCFSDDPDQFVRSLVLFRLGVEFLFAEDGEYLHLLNDLADVLDGVHDVTGAGFSLGADHASTFSDATQGFAEVAGSADEGDLERVLVDVVSFVGGGEDFGLVDVVDAEFLKNLGFGKMADTTLGHNRDRHGGHDFANLFGRGHAGNAAFGADLRRNALEGHDGYGAGSFGDGGLVGVGDVHDDAA